jgi:hypothetical protein
VKSRVAGGKIDQVPAVAKNGAQRIAQRMLAKGPDLGCAERLRKPLHVVLHEDLHRCAADRASAVNGRRNPARRRDVRAHERFLVPQSRSFYLFLGQLVKLQSPGSGAPPTPHGKAVMQ